MLYLKKSPDPQVVWVPAATEKLPGRITISVVNVVNRGAPVVLDSDTDIYLVDATGAYVQDSTGAQIVLSGSSGGGTLPAVPDTSRLYYAVGVIVPSTLPVGEYEYTADADGVTVSTGLLYIGDFAPNIQEYENTAQYEQYNDY